MNIDVLNTPGTADALSRGTWRLIDTVMQWMESARAEYEYRRAQTALEAMNDHQLRDLGIRRSDIPLVVRGQPIRRCEL